MNAPQPEITQCGHCRTRFESVEAHDRHRSPRALRTVCNLEGITQVGRTDHGLAVYGYRPFDTWPEVVYELEPDQATEMADQIPAGAQVVEK